MAAAVEEGGGDVSSDGTPSGGCTARAAACLLNKGKRGLVGKLTGRPRSGDLLGGSIKIKDLPQGRS